jgi:hypothetical protein
MQREGLTLHDISYDGRKLFYRLSLSEMFVPYGDSRAPYPRKAAFDLGNNGAGVNANNLQLGKLSISAWKSFVPSMTDNRLRLRLPRAHKVLRQLHTHQRRRPNQSSQRHLLPRNRRWHSMETHQLPNRQCHRRQIQSPRSPNHHHRRKLRIHILIPIQPSRSNKL